MDFLHSLQAASGCISALLSEERRELRMRTFLALELPNFLGLLTSPWLPVNSRSCSETKKVKSKKLTHI